MFTSSQKLKLKLIVLGDTVVLKTTLVARFKDIDLPDFAPTIGCNFSSLTYDNFLINVWDTAGQERYHAILDLYFKDVDICLLVFDVHEPSTLMRIFDVWLPRYLNSKHNNTADYTHKMFYLIGNKDDESSLGPHHNKELRNILHRYQTEIKKYQIKMWTVSALKNRHLGELLTDIGQTAKQQVVPYKTIEQEADSMVVNLVSHVRDQDAKSWTGLFFGSCNIL